MNNTVLASRGGERPRGRPRAFCIDAAMDAGEALFAERGYEAVSVAELCAAMGIKPPSFYAAFGSKAALFARVVGRYAEGRGGAVLRDAMRAEPDPRRGVPAMLAAAADAYAAGSLGCLVMEGARGTDEAAAGEACDAARAATRAAIRDYVAPATDEPEMAASLIATALTGLSGAARGGADRDELRAFAELAGEGIAARLRFDKL